MSYYTTIISISSGIATLEVRTPPRVVQRSVSEDLVNGTFLTQIIPEENGSTFFGVLSTLHDVDRRVTQIQDDVTSSYYRSFGTFFVY